MTGKREDCVQAAVRIHQMCQAIAETPPTRNDLQMLIEAIDAFLARIGAEVNQKPLT
ncbi:MAG: hypothetical protein ACM3X4_11565 [Ignavibacteriales bacterium]